MSDNNKMCSRRFSIIYVRRIFMFSISSGINNAWTDINVVSLRINYALPKKTFTTLHKYIRKRYKLLRVSSPYRFILDEIENAENF